MADTISWAWHVTSPWPGYSAGNNDNLTANGNGLSVDPNSYSDITWRDGDRDGRIADTDQDDGTYNSPDQVLVGTNAYSVKEIANYLGGSMVANGITYTVDLGVWLLADGSYLVRIDDQSIPAGVHHLAVTSVTLGTFSGVEYSYSNVAPRSAPFVCFVKGTRIFARNGLVKVEELQPGDLVLTADHGYQPLRWVGQRSTMGKGAAAPVLIRAGALGNSRDLRLSQQHRVVHASWKSELLFGTTETLIAAVHLINGDSIRLAPCPQVTYVHLLFDHHEVVFSEGLATESFHPSAYGLSVLDHETRDEVISLFPELDNDLTAYGDTARPCLRGWEARALMPHDAQVSPG